MEDADQAARTDRPRESHESTLDAVLRAYRLKDELRRGWVLRGVRAPESVAGHAWGTALLCLAFAEEAGVDRERALAIATVHDLAEAEIGDIPARAHPAERAVAADRKAQLEAEGLERLLDGSLAEVWALWREYDAGASPEARFVRDMNLLDMALQALLYEQHGRYDVDAAPPSGGSRGHLDEFLVSAERRMQGEPGRRLVAQVASRYRRLRQRPG